MKNLPVISTVMDAYAFVWEQRRDFLLYAFLPVLIGALAQTLLTVFLAPAVGVPNGAEAPQPVGGPSAAVVIGFVIGFAVSLVLYVMFAVAWHRRFLVEEQTTVGAALRWGPRHMQFLGRIGVLALVGVPILVLLPMTRAENAGLTVPLLFIVMIVTVLAYARLLLLLPAAAIDERLTIQGAWQLTRGLGGRMFGIAVLPLIPILFVSAIATAPLRAAIIAFGLSESFTAIFVSALVEQVFAFAGFAVAVSALSIAYRDLKAQAGSGSTAVTT